MIKKAGAALLVVVVAILLGWTVPARAQEKTVTAKILSPNDAFKPGGTYTLTIRIAVAPPFHINAEVPSEDYLVGTAVTFAPQTGVTFGKIVFPQAETRRLSFSQNPLAVYSGTVNASVEVSLDKDFKGSEFVTEGTVSYQACNDQSCLPPEEAAFSSTFPVTGPDTKKTVAAISPSPEKTKPRPAGVGAFGISGALGFAISRTLRP